MTMLTIKRINTALAEAGIGLTLVYEKKDYHPFHFTGPGIHLIHHSVVPNRKKVNDLPLDKWIEYAKHFEEQAKRQLERYQLPDWMVVGATVVLSEGGVARSDVIERITGDGSEMFKLHYEKGRETWVWGRGEHCAGPHVYRDQAMLDAAREQAGRISEMVNLFSRLSRERQIELIEMAKS